MTLEEAQEEAMKIMVVGCPLSWIVDGRDPHQKMRKKATALRDLIAKGLMDAAANGYRDGLEAKGKA